MRSDYLPDDLKTLWQELATNPVQISPVELRREARRLGSGVRLRNSFVVVVCSLIITAYTFFAFRSSTAFERIGAILSVAGTINVIVQYLKRPSTTLTELGTTESIRFYRAQLERHRDFHRGKGICAWLLPVLPGPIIFNVAFAIDRPVFAPIVAFQMAIFLLAAIVVFPLNLRMARKYQRRIDALDFSIR
jgi:hypothetical protein